MNIILLHQVDFEFTLGFQKVNIVLKRDLFETSYFIPLGRNKINQIND